MKYVESKQVRVMSIKEEFVESVDFKMAGSAEFRKAKSDVLFSNVRVLDMLLNAAKTAGKDEEFLVEVEGWLREKVETL